MRILISGSSGLIGGALSESLTSSGHRVTRLVRRAVPPEEDAVAWDPRRGGIDADGLEGIDAVVHLAGEGMHAPSAVGFVRGVGDHRWTASHKARIVDSRVRGTRLLAETIAGLKSPPRVMLSASGIDYYGDGGDEVLTESSAPGTGFLADLVRQWESSTEPAEAAGLRVVHMRSGAAVTPRGGLLRPQLLPFKLGLGARLGSGRQYLSWITLEDHVGAIEFLLQRDDIAGPVNLTAPNPVTNAEWTRALGAALGRPTLITAPSFALKLMFGTELAEEMLLGSKRVIPTRLQEAGYQFDDPEIGPALRRMLS